MKRYACLVLFFGGSLILSSCGKGSSGGGGAAALMGEHSSEKSDEGNSSTISSSNSWAPKSMHANQHVMIYTPSGSMYLNMIHQAEGNESVMTCIQKPAGMRTDTGDLFSTYRKVGDNDAVLVLTGSRHDDIEKLVQSPFNKDIWYPTVVGQKVTEHRIEIKLHYNGPVAAGTVTSLVHTENGKIVTSFTNGRFETQTR